MQNYVKISENSIKNLEILLNISRVFCKLVDLGSLMIRNTFHTVLHTLGPLATFCRNSTDVQCKPAALLPHHPTKCPADIGFPPFSPTSPTNPDLTTRYVAIDITIPPAPLSAPSLIPSQIPSPHPLLAAHEGSAQRKFIGRTSQVDAAILMADLNANHITLLPFTVDHLGGFGYFTHMLLFGDHSPHRVWISKRGMQFEE